MALKTVASKYRGVKILVSLSRKESSAVVRALHRRLSDPDLPEDERYELDRALAEIKRGRLLARWGAVPTKRGC